MYPTVFRVPGIERRDKKVLLNKQYKDIEENNRIGKISDLLNKIGDTKGTFHTKIGKIKDRYSRI